MLLLSISHSPSNLLPSSSPLRYTNPNPHTPQSLSSHQQTPTKSPIQRICEKLRKLNHLPNNPSPFLPPPPQTSPKTPGEIFIPTPHQIPIHRVGHTLDPSWSSPDHPSPTPGSGDSMIRLGFTSKFPAADKGSKVPSVAELNLPREELKRLRGLGIGLRRGIKVGKAGVTEGIVNGIHERWRRAEVVKVRCEDICRMNMKRTHEILEVG